MHPDAKRIVSLFMHFCIPLPMKGTEMPCGDSIKLDRKPVLPPKYLVRVGAGDFAEHLVVKVARPSVPSGKT